MDDGVKVRERIYTIWDAYQEIKARRDFDRTLIEVVKRSRSWDEPLLNAMQQQERWADQMMTAIELAHGLEHEG